MLSGCVLRCGVCDYAITGERIRRELRDGQCNTHVYYRCGNNHPDPGHPKVRWREADMDAAIIKELDTCRLPTPRHSQWFRNSLVAAFDDVDAAQAQRRKTLVKRRTELANMQDRLLHGYLCGAIDEGTFQSKTTDLNGQLQEVERSLQRCGDIGAACGDMHASRGDIALAAFDWSQTAPEAWQRSKIAQKRVILNSLSLNRTLSATSLYVPNRKPFSFLAERPSIQSNRGDWI